ncbi:hypothetical protein Tsubulata_034696 [Turnera subulata]|uniref:DUF632 domain-containing protein n=1 Tax=Turnera subulata TaxID=218843 RepID=A0A9Q0FSJ8_9ROSI|nr:hypothetical protein Tsubulata_034696 [Turnera subulata]
MGCALSKKDEEDDVVSLCRERKRLLKLAVERRYAFADAQYKYNQSLYTVAMAIRLFVARHSSQASPFLITFSSKTSSCNDSGETHITTNSMFLQQRPTEPLHETMECKPSNSKVSLESSHLETGKKETQEEGDMNSGEEGSDIESESESESGDVCEHFYESENGENVACEHFYSEVGAAMPSPQREFGWDFFYPFDEMRTQVADGFFPGIDEDLRAVREKEGIPELEEDGERAKGECDVVNVKIGVEEDHKESKVPDVRSGDTANAGFEESEGLKVIDTPTNGRELLEALKDIEDHFIRAHDSGLEVSRMLEANRVQLLSGLEEIKGGFLFFLVPYYMLCSCPRDQAGDLTRKAFERKCSHMRNRYTRLDGNNSTDKSRSEVKELHARISVAIRSAESISDRIQKLRDEELQPQLLELLHGLMRNWKIMMDSHETQNRVMLEVKSFNCPAYQKFSNDSHHLATLQLEAELHNWRSCFSAYVSAQKEYIEAITGWLSRFIAPEVELYSSGKSSLPPCRINWPPLLVTCHEWYSCLEKLPCKDVTCAMKNLGRDIHALKSQQGDEQQQKRKADGLVKDLERRTLAFERAERRILESKISESEVTTRNPIEYLAERKNLLDSFRKRVDEEQEKHRCSMQETQRITINGFQTGFSSVFESLTEFSKASVKMYDDLLRYSANAETIHKSDGKM